jgi:uncharacterized protein (DUF433 family)
LKENKQMGRINWKEHIIVDSNVHHGEACIKGTRISVTTIVCSLADGMTSQEIIEAYPQVSLVDIRASLAYAAHILILLLHFVRSISFARQAIQ